MALITRWYLTKYDTDVHRDRLGVVNRATRVPAMYRYIPQEHNPDGYSWMEMQILGNHLIVKVLADEVMHTTILGDMDFLRIEATMTPNLSLKLGQLGYTQEDISSLGTRRSDILRGLERIGRNRVRKNLAWTDHEVMPERLPNPPRIDLINRRLP